MARKATPKIASPGTKADAAPKKKPSPEVPAASLSALAPGADPSAFVARLCPVDIPGSIKILGRYKSDRATFENINDRASSARGVMNATKKEMIDKGWSRKAVSWAMDLFAMDPEVAQKVLAQTFVLCRSKVLDVPLGVVNGSSGDLFDPDRVYRFGKLNSETPAPLVDPSTLPGQSVTERMADIFENGRSSGLKGEHMKIPPGIADDPKAVETYTAGWTKGQAELLARGGQPAADNVVAFSTVADDAPTEAVG